MVQLLGGTRRQVVGVIDYPKCVLEAGSVASAGAVATPSFLLTVWALRAARLRRGAHTKHLAVVGKGARFLPRREGWGGACSSGRPSWRGAQ